MKQLSACIQIEIFLQQHVFMSSIPSIWPGLTIVCWLRIPLDSLFAKELHKLFRKDKPLSHFRSTGNVETSVHSKENLTSWWWGKTLLSVLFFFLCFVVCLFGWLVGWYDENLTVVHNSLGCCDAAGRRPQGELGEGGARGFEWRESRPHNALLWPHSPSDNHVWVISTFNCLIWRKNCHGSWHQIKGVFDPISTSFTPHFSLNQHHEHLSPALRRTRGLFWSQKTLVGNHWRPCWRPLEASWPDNGIFLCRLPKRPHQGNAIIGQIYQILFGKPSGLFFSWYETRSHQQKYIYLS